jgi:hypothetical protein
MYNINVKLKDDELAAKVNAQTGEISFVKKGYSNIPKDKSLLNYNNFSLVNNDAIRVLSTVLSNEELGIVYKMIEKACFNTNSLKPFSDETSIRVLAEEFNIGKNKVGGIFKKLFEWGVYAHIRIHETEISEYWILNPYISWKGKLKSDSIFVQFANTKISKLLS